MKKKFLILFNNPYKNKDINTQDIKKLKKNFNDVILYNFFEKRFVINVFNSRNGTGGLGRGTRVDSSPSPRAFTGTNRCDWSGVSSSWNHAQESAKTSAQVKECFRGFGTQ